MLREAGVHLHIRWIGFALEAEPELLPLPELPVLFFLRVAYGLEASCGEEDIPERGRETTEGIKVELGQMDV